jgi:hypothetical protein
MSLLWKIDLYTKCGSTAKCKDCGQVLKLCDGSTKSLMTHLNSHPSYLEKYTKLKEDKPKDCQMMMNFVQINVKVTISCICLIYMFLSLLL